MKSFLLFLSITALGFLTPTSAPLDFTKISSRLISTL
jgi:hypothetical protein